MNFTGPQYLRIKQIVTPHGILPIGKSTFWNGVKTGRYPAPVKLSARVTAWKASDIQALIERIDRGEL